MVQSRVPDFYPSPEKILNADTGSLLKGLHSVMLLWSAQNLALVLNASEVP